MDEDCLLLGIDVGTTLIKSIVFNIKGEILGSYSLELPVERPRPGYVEQDLSKLENAFYITIRSCLTANNIPPEKICVVSITAHQHGTFLLDKNGKPVLDRAIIWPDIRTQDILMEFCEKNLDKIIYKISGWRLITSLQLLHLIWLKRFKPAETSKAKYFLSCKDYLRYKLTDKLCTDVTDASYTGIMDIRKRIWSRELIEELGISYEIFPEIKDPWEDGGFVTEIASRRTGLKTGTPVVVGAGDGPLTVLGSGAVKPGQLGIIIGTAGVYGLVSNRPDLDPEMRHHVCCFPRPNSWLLLCLQMNTASALKWFKDVFGYEEVLQSEKEGLSPYKLMDMKASSSSVGAKGIMFHPFLQGERSPFTKPTARGIFFGFGTWNTKSDFIRAVLEGVGLSARDNIEVFRERGYSLTEAIMAGGGAKSEFWPRVFADILNLEIKIPKVEECGALGSAILGSVYLRIYKDIDEACDSMIKFEKCYHPEPTNVEKYNLIFPLYRKLYKTLWDVYDEFWKTYQLLGLL